MTDVVQKFHGERGNEFKKLITGLLNKGNLKKKYIDALTDEESMRIYSQVFTSASYDAENNYEVYEQLGDVTANKFIVWYSYRRFPKLNCPAGVKIVARIRINYGSRSSFASIGEEQGFWPFISASEEIRSKKKKDLLEDCVEAFFGATESILDNKFMIGVGSAIVYQILKSIFDKIHISLKYTDLFDAKTRLKELLDTFKDLGTLRYDDSREEEGQFSDSEIYLQQSKRMGGRSFLIGSGRASKKADAQQIAAEKALLYLNQKGYAKDLSKEYTALIDEY